MQSPSEPDQVPKTKARLFAWHGWLGLNFGLLLFIITLAGAFAVLSQELDELVTPAMRLEKDAGPMSWSNVLEYVRLAEPDAVVRSMAMPRGPGLAATVLVDRPNQKAVRLYVNPESGEILGETSSFNLQTFFKAFHTTLFFPDKPLHGTYVVAIFSFVLLFAVLTGLLFYKHWWRHLFRLRAHLGWKVAVSDLHRLLGSWTLVFSALMAVTGVWFFFKWMPFVQARWEIRAPKVAENVLEQLPPDELVAKAQAALPGLRPRLFRPAEIAGDPVYIDGYLNSPLLGASATHVFLNPATGEVAQRQTPENVTGLRRWLYAADELHFGRFGAWENLPLKILWSFLGLCLPAMVLTGAVISLKRAGISSVHMAWWSVGLTALILAYGLYSAFGAIKGYGPIAEDVATGEEVQSFPAVPTGVWLVIGVFLFLQAAAVAAWYGLAWQMFRRRGRAGALDA